MNAVAWLILLCVFYGFLIGYLIGRAERREGRKITSSEKATPAV